MSIRVMIVEDEPIIRVGIAQVLPWKELECEVVSLASNGVEGIEKAKETNPQLVITDIRMPQMTGLEMIEKLRPDYPDMEFILLTGYKEFEYAHKAISFGVNDYILKPVDQDQLIESVKRLVNHIHQKTKMLDEWESLRLKVKESIPLLRDKLLHSLLFSGTDNIYNVYEKMDYFNIHICQFALMCVSIDSFHDLEMKFTEEDIQVLQFLIEYQINGLMSEYELNAYTFRHKKDIYAIFYEQKEPIQMNTLLNYGKELTERIEKTDRFTVSIGLSRLHNGVEELRKARKEADCCILRCDELGYGTVLCIEDLQEQGKNDIAGTELSLECYYRVLKESGDTTDEIEKICRQLYEIKNMIVVKNFCSEMISRTFRILIEEYGEEEELLKQCNRAMEESFMVKNIAGLESILKEQSIWCRDFIAAQRNTRVRYLMHQAIDYMKENCQKDVSLEEVADALYISKWYFSKLFKKETGTKFTDYMSMLRIEEAKRLIRENPGLKNYEIADMLNFGNVRYFGQMFKKIVGKTPSEYRGKE